ncbi:hypothetical protein [Micromonospora sp. CPCC 205556]|uniref:hypothetical protein n=1 Tax=Micromonospora sp. CPCC 205556 TaxID=3122398 RepID=UPI002FF1ED02
MTTATLARTRRPPLVHALLTRPSGWRANCCTPDMFSGWGIRKLCREEPAYNGLG